MPDLFCVLHKDLSYSSEKTAEFLAAERCVSRVEAAAAFKKSPGFLLENAELGKSSAFNLRASAFGLETILVSQRDLKSPPPASVLSKIEFTTEGFNYFSNCAGDYVPFEAVKSVTACAFAAEMPSADEVDTLWPLQTDSPQTTGQDAGIIHYLRARYFPFALPFGGKYRQPSETPRHSTPSGETVFRADILTSGPGPLRLAINCDKHDYSGLGARKTLSSFENFRIVLDELSSRASGAVRNPFLQALLGKKTLSGLKYPSAEAYEKELVWINTVR